MLKILIGKTRSKKYPQIEKYAMELGGVSTDEGIGIYVLNSNIIQNISTLMRIASLTSDLKNVTTLFENKSLNLYRFVRHMFELKTCADGFSIIDSKYCWINSSKQGWGCKFIDAPIRHLCKSNTYVTDKFWYNIGKFKDENTWVINKALLTHKIAVRSKERAISLCQYFRSENVSNIIRQLPDRIDPNGKDFEKYYTLDFEKDTISKKAINIRHISKKSEKEKQKEERSELIRKFEYQIASGQLMGTELKKTLNSLRMLRSDRFGYNLDIESGMSKDDVKFSEN